jgi:hypothetical protein
LTRIARQIREANFVSTLLTINHEGLSMTRTNPITLQQQAKYLVSIIRGDQDAAQNMMLMDNHHETLIETAMEEHWLDENDPYYSKSKERY